MPDSWSVEYTHIQEEIVPGKRLGRHVRHDSRNWSYPHFRQDRQLTSQLWARTIPILNQGDVGSCTAEAGVGALATEPLVAALPAAHPVLDQAFSYTIYSAEETLDGDGPYPPQDNGSSGPTCGQVLKNLGLVSGYTHAFDLASLLDALEDGPALLGINWYQGFDSPDSTGLVTISGNVRGGHEVLARGKDVDRQVIHCDNSWGAAWGNQGSFDIGYGTMTRLLAEQGDVTVLVPLTVPAPQPVPVPVQPQPEPVPPAPAPVVDAADATLYRQVRTWVAERHIGSNSTVAADLRTWIAAKGLD